MSKRFGLAALAVGAIGCVVAVVSQLENARPPRSILQESTSVRATAENASELARPEDDRTQRVSVPPGAGAELPEADPAPASHVDGIWLTGRVKFPEGTPGDETVVVVARGRRFASGEREHEAQCAGDGTFRVAFGPRTFKGTLSLRARYLYLPESKKLDPREVGSDIVLEPLLGGRASVRVTPPPGAGQDALEGTVVMAVARESSLRRATDVHSGGVFELGGLPVGEELILSAAAERYCDAEMYDASVGPGETRDFELVLKRGVLLAGSAVGVDGHGIEGANVQVEIVSSDSHYRAGLGSTDADGLFTLRGLEPGRITLEISSSGFVPESVALGELADGESVTDLELVMDAGLAISGVVRWPDGSPAEGARVTVAQGTQRASPFGGSQMQSAEAEGDGSFTISGLTGRGPRLVTAKARRALPEAADGPPDGASRSRRGKRTQWRAALEVEPPIAGLELILDPGLALRGRLTDDRGKPIGRRFMVRATQDPEGGASGRGSGAVWDSTRAEDGSFELRGMTPGTWYVSAEAPGHAATEIVEVVVPQRGAVALVARRQGRFSGVVVDSSGRPVAAAKVEVRLRERWGWLSVEERRTAQDGSFTFGWAPGEWGLTASKKGFASSELAPLSLEPGGKHDGLRFVLRRPARILGSVDPAAGTVSGRSVSAHGRSAPGTSSSSTTEADGTFELTGLTPGPHEVFLDPIEDAAGASSSGATVPVVVELSEGETAYVVLGAGPRAAVRVFGRITEAGRAVPGVRVELEGERWTGAATTSSDGSYECVVDGPGEYRVWLARGTESVGAYQVQLPADVTEYERDFELFAGRIVGSVTGCGGQAIADCSVVLESEVDMGFFPAGATTDRGGRFELAFVPPGTYRLTVAGSAPPARGVRCGFVVVRGLQLAKDQVVEVPALTLPPAATIEGEVRTSSGEPVGDAWVLLRNRDGTSIPAGGAMSDALGKFSCTGVGAGDVMVQAWKDGRTSASTPLSVVAGGAHRVELVLEE